MQTTPIRNRLILKTTVKVYVYTDKNNRRLKEGF